MVASFFTVNNQTFSDYRSPAIHIVLSSKLLMFFNTSHIESPFDDKRQLQDFLAKLPTTDPKNTVDNNLILQREWKILISTKSVCQIDEIKILRMLQVERNGQILRQKYKEIAKNLYTFSEYLEKPNMPIIQG
ncbi:hypothetical protein DINM_005261 [Dirofilaria immitis]|nr:hypothetical protein [Dirofilaria immitis]